MTFVSVWFLVIWISSGTVDKIPYPTQTDCLKAKVFVDAAVPMNRLFCIPGNILVPTKEPVR